MIEAKGKDSYPVKNHMNFIFASNNDWVVPAGKEERRFMTLRVSELDPTRGNIKEYFEKLCTQMENGGCEALHYYLLNYDISKVDLRNIPKTDELLEQKKLSMSPIEKWWDDALNNGGFYLEDDEKKEYFIQWREPFFIEAKDLYNSFLAAAKNMNGKNHLSDSQFGKKIKDFCNKEKLVERKTLEDILHRSKVRINCYCLPSLQECRRYFEISVGMENKYVLANGV